MATPLTILAGIAGLGMGELTIILVILLVLFGGSKLPGLAKGLGQSIREFKRASKDEETAAPSEKKIESTKTHGTN